MKQNIFMVLHFSFVERENNISPSKSEKMNHLKLPALTQQS